jgi:hypothetical protein
LPSSFPNGGFNRRLKSLCMGIFFVWGHSSAGRAPALQAGGQRFDPAWLHHYSLIAQLVEHSTVNRVVTGSSPVRGAIFQGPLVKWLRHLPFTEVTGVRVPYGSPSILTKIYPWRLSSAGRASALQAEGRRFDPVSLHHFIWLRKRFRRYSQVVRQSSAKALPPVRIWVAPLYISRSGGIGRRTGLKILR